MRSPPHGLVSPEKLIHKRTVAKRKMVVHERRGGNNVIASNLCQVGHSYNRCAPRTVQVGLRNCGERWTFNADECVVVFSLLQWRRQTKKQNETSPFHTRQKTRSHIISLRDAPHLNLHKLVAAILWRCGRWGHQKAHAIQCHFQKKLPDGAASDR